MSFKIPTSDRFSIWSPVGFRQEARRHHPHQEYTVYKAGTRGRPRPAGGPRVRWRTRPGVDTPDSRCILYAVYNRATDARPSRAAPGTMGWETPKNSRAVTP